jgi:hypothetical protein
MRAAEVMSVCRTRFHADERAACVAQPSRSLKKDVGGEASWIFSMRDGVLIEHMNSYYPTSLQLGLPVHRLDTLPSLLSIPTFHIFRPSMSMQLLSYIEIDTVSEWRAVPPALAVRSAKRWPAASANVHCPAN